MSYGLRKRLTLFSASVLSSLALVNATSAQPSDSLGPPPMADEPWRHPSADEQTREIFRSTGQCRAVCWIDERQCEVRYKSNYGDDLEIHVIRSRPKTAFEEDLAQLSERAYGVCKDLWATR